MMFTALSFTFTQDQPGRLPPMSRTHTQPDATGPATVVPDAQLAATGPATVVPGTKPAPTCPASTLPRATCGSDAAATAKAAAIKSSKL